MFQLSALRKPSSSKMISSISRIISCLITSMTFRCRASGGVSILIRNDIQCSKVNMKTNIQAIAIKATLHKAVNICSIYIPPNDDIDKNEVKKLVDQLPKPFILLEDYDSHNTLWGCKDVLKKGKILEKIVYKNMCLLNNGTLTYVRSSSRNHSAFDLTISDPTVYMDFTWKLYDDTCGSDHFPITIKSTEPSCEKNTHWKLDKANWGNI